MRMGMKITNKMNLPQAIVDAVSSDYVQPDDTLRVTQLLKGTCEIVLEKRYGEEVERDASDMIWAIFGTAVHKIIEDASEEEYQIKEARLYEDVAGMVLTGKFDLYDGKTQTAHDWKTCSVWKIVYGDFEDWRKQLLMYAWLLTQAGFPCHRGEVTALMKDHSKSKAKFDPSYPQYPVMQIVFEFSEEDIRCIEQDITDKIVEIKHALTLDDEDLTPCTAEERWNSGDKYAVMKGKNKRALRVLDSEKEAMAWNEANKDKGGTHIEVRKGEDKKCSEYCSVNAFCPYWISQQEQEKGE